MNVPNILVINCGSSSLKFSVVNTQTGDQSVSGLAERLGDPNASLTIKTKDGSTSQKQVMDIANGKHDRALSALLDYLYDADVLQTIQAVGHRVVHGGERFTTSTLITDEVLNAIEACNHLAPLHNPANIIGITACQQLLADIPHVAVFDTAFHQTMSEEAYLYPIPLSIYKEHGVRRYGFHGTSHRYVVGALAERLQTPVSSLNLITAHLGNGCSAAAVKEGRSVDTTMGLTPLEGLMMGTRSGDIDPSIHHFLCTQMDMSIDQVNNLLNKKSGLLGLSELSNDMRTLEQAAQEGNAQAEMAIQVFCYRLAKHIAALAVPLGKVDGLIFTGGIGENSVSIRQRVLAQLQVLGFKVDDQLNQQGGDSETGLVTLPESTPAYVVNTDEEWMIAKDTLACLN